MQCNTTWHWFAGRVCVGSAAWLMVIAMSLALAPKVVAGGEPTAWEGSAELTLDTSALEAGGVTVQLRGFDQPGEGAPSGRARVWVSRDWQVASDTDGYPIASGSFDVAGAIMLGTSGGRVVLGNLRLSIDRSGRWSVIDTLSQDGLAFPPIEFTPRSTAYREATGRYRLAGDLALGRGWRDVLGLSRGASLHLGALVVSLEHAKRIDRASRSPDRAGAGADEASGGIASVVGPDVIVGDLYQIANYGVVNNLVVLSVGTISCNIGTEAIPWIANTNHHPVIAQNIFRLKNGEFEQIGMSWLKHGFYAVSGSLCYSDCHATDGSSLGVHCSDPYSANLNGTQANLGPRSQVNAFTGEFPYPPITGNPSGTAARRLQAALADMDQSLNAGAKYFVEGQYVTPDDSAAGNQDNNNSYRPVTVSGAGSAVTVQLSGTTHRQQPAISAWRDTDPAVVQQSARVPSEGLFVVAAKATDLGDGYWSYEYAVQNINSDRSGGWFRVPVAPTADVRNIGFHDVNYHSGEPFDGTDWSASRSSVALTWSTTPFDTWPDANALRWGSLYNFRFEADVPPEMSTVTIGLFRPGTPDRVEVTMTGPVTNASDCNGNDVPDSTDIGSGTSQDCNGNLIPDECETHRPMAEVVASGAADPVAVTTAPDDADLVYVAQRSGLIRVIEAGSFLATPFLDLSANVAGGPEQGLLDLEFDSDFADNGRFYVSYVNPGGSTIIAQFTALNSRYVADAASQTILKTIAQPFPDGNGGLLAFAPDGTLYVGMSDGGGTNDPSGRGQEPGTLLGKILRLDVDNPPFYIPADNPFVGTGLPVDEIWSLGVHAPRGLSVDRETGDLYVADHGTGIMDEVSIEPGSSAGGRNLGWRCMEGTTCTGLSGCTCNAPSLTLPDVTIGGGPDDCGIVGGPVYEGCILTDSVGAYFYANTCTGTFGALRWENGIVVEQSDITSQVEAVTGPIPNVAAFGEDANGEILLASASGTIYRWVANPAVCGNDVLEPGEGCDDGNDIAGDGCAPDCTLEPAAANDHCETALEIGEGAFPFTTVNSTTDGPVEPLLCNFNGQTGFDHDVWYVYTPSCGGAATISTCSADFDTRVAAYAGDVCPSQSSTAIACNDDACGAASQLSFDVDACVPYLIRVGGTDGASGSGTLSVQCDPQPLVDDCNGNFVNDSVDITCQTSTDGNGNGVPDECETDGDAILGGRLYDNWWSELTLAAPVDDHPLWAYRPDTVSNNLTGADTWRCAECHGWDYKGVDGRYGTGVHRTGIPGILHTNLDATALFDLLKEPPNNGGGSGIENGHDYGSVLPDIRINDLVAFVLSGAIDDNSYINGVTGSFVGDPVAGEHNFQFEASPACTVCHGANGATINFGTPTAPEYLGTIANDNPWEMLHKIRFGQPAAPMPSWLAGGGTNQGATDIGRYAQLSLARDCTLDSHCDDGIACTLNVCDSDGRCVYVPDDSLCADDGVFCDGPELCIAGVGCMTAGNPCTGACDEITGCECPAPTVTSPGSRYLTVLVPATIGNAPVAIVVRPTCGSEEYYVGTPSGPYHAAPLVSDRSLAAVLDPDTWATVDVFGTEIIPETSYEVWVDCGTDVPQLSAPADGTTGTWGDVTGAYVDGVAPPPDGRVDFLDIAGVVDSFLGSPGAPPVLRADLFGCQPEQVVDFADIAAIVSAFLGDSYQDASLCEVPCGP